MAYKANEGPEVEPENSPIEDMFSRDCANTVVRVLTAKAVQKVLMQMGPVDGFTAKWLNSYCADHPPLEGNAFLSRLMSERPRMEVDPYTGNTHHITPVTLANRIMATREDLVQDVSKLIGPQVHKDNVLILRTHLEAHTYVSGTNEEKKPNYRGYRKEGKHQQSQYQL